MRTPKIRPKPKEGATIAVIPMTDVRLQWASDGVHRDGLPEGNPDTQFGVWQFGCLLCMTPVHHVAVNVALLQAGDEHNVVDLSTETILLAGQETWAQWPTG
ncbi:hypothetical protein [Brucella grignonensis]|uniref:Uncharacterized protein n=1 Tax=Brucella grignonensis TaxID=94627 RepID=A0A256F389_9HYPH|nr:hypothetical protein [Brucella grignonensis]OYR09200.1 hypothetical protein CEV33_2929 [Brucella grignonensis]